MQGGVSNAIQDEMNMTMVSVFRVGAASALACCLTPLLSACGSIGGLNTSVGPSKGDIRHSLDAQGIQIINVDNAVTAHLRTTLIQSDFSHSIGGAMPIGNIVGPGDVLGITIWEAPPATLFGATASGIARIPAIATGNEIALPEIMVGPDGVIALPYVGSINVQGMRLAEIERTIMRRLQGKAHLPQIMVRFVRNATSDISIVGEVEKSMRMPLTPKGERLLDALAAAGGTKQPIGKMTVQITRDGALYSMPLAEVVKDPRQNVILQAGDVVTAVFQPYSFTVLGASGRNSEINFEATGLTLSQALGRMEGLQDRRADPKGVFLFRWEKKDNIANVNSSSIENENGLIPVIYRIDMKQPGTYFSIQNFYVRDHDVIYIANSPLSEFERFFGIISSTVFPIAAVNNSLR